MTRSPSTASASTLVQSDVLVAEHYLPSADPLSADELTLLLRAGEGRFLHALYLPGDETCFAVYDGSPATARAVRPPGSLDRIVPAVLLEQGRNGR